MPTIGSVVLPSGTVLERIGETITLRPATHSIPKGRAKMYWFGTDLPRVRYEGILFHSGAMNYLESMKEMFRSTDADWPLYAKLDENFYFLANGFSWDKEGGFRKTFRFDLDLIWYGNNGGKIRQVGADDAAVVSNDWNI